MARHKVEICGVNTANLKVLSNCEMTILFNEYKKGNKIAKEKIINGNLKLVLSILKKYNNRCDNMDDLFQIGCIGLIKAIDNFDLSFNVKFSTYAVPMILGEVKRYLRDNNSIRVSRSLKDIAYHAYQTKEELTNKLNREPTIKEIANTLNLTEFEISNAFDSMRDILSISEPIYNDGGDTIYLEDQIEDKSNNMYNIDEKIALKEIPKELGNEESQKALDNEINICEKLDNTNIVKMIKIEKNIGDKNYLVYELCNGGDLRVYMDYFKIFDEELIQIIVIKMVNALFELHRKGVVHHDIKPENILIHLFPDENITQEIEKKIEDIKSAKIELINMRARKEIDSEEYNKRTDELRSTAYLLKALNKEDYTRFNKTNISKRSRK